MDPTDNKDEEQKNAGGIPVLRINRRKRWNLNVRLRRSTDPGAQPIYTTVTIYPASQVLDAKGQEISESDPDYESVYVEFGPNGMNQLTKMAAADPHLELDLLIPTLDEAISVYGGRMIQRKPGVRGNQNVWIWDLDVSHDLRELVYGREVEDLRPDTLDASVADDPLLAVLRRGRPAS